MTETIKQRTAHITPENGDAVTVRRMAHKPAREFLRLLSKHAAALAPALGAGDTAALFAKAQELVVATDELSTHLIAHSTGLAPDQIDGLDFIVALEILRAALELNLGDELKKSLLGIREALAALFPSMTRTNATANSTPGL
ncbi:MAG: hypothetical protein LBC18_03310 [Opitutaceae bacterium]|jgi:hypothetical protein|nr:hypothetical protein [Opitutaceae bacterium]